VASRVNIVWTHTPGGKDEFYKNGRSVCDRYRNILYSVLDGITAAITVAVEKH